MLTFCYPPSITCEACGPSYLAADMVSEGLFGGTLQESEPSLARIHKPMNVGLTVPLCHLRLLHVLRKQGVAETLTRGVGL